MDSERLSALIHQYLGTQVLTLLQDPNIEEVYINPDLLVRAITSSGQRIATSVTLLPQSAEAFLRAISTITLNRFDRDYPSLAAAVSQTDLGKCRIQGFIPPLTSGPAFNIRKPCRTNSYTARLCKECNANAK